MHLVINPYHLTTRELPAMAGLLLAREAVTLLPAPSSAADREAFIGATSALPGYRAFVESWEWARPLWEEGVVAPSLDGSTAIDDVRAACDAIGSEPRFEPLRRFMRPDLFEASAAGLELIGRDIVKGGPDPGVCVPVAAGLDSFAARLGVFVVRAHPSSVAQQAEARLSTTLFRFGVPLFRQASAETVLEARERLEPELDDLRDAVDAAMLAGLDAADPRAFAQASVVADARDAAHRYAEAFEAARADLTDVDEDDTHPIVVEAAISAQRLPSDAVLRSSRAAVRSLDRPLARAKPETPGTALMVDNAPPCGTLVIRDLGRS